LFPKTLAKLRCPVDGGSLAILTSLGPDESGEIVDGVLQCAKCDRWFRVERGVPDLVRDELREDEDERRFIGRHRALLPDRIALEGKPVSLNTPPIVRSDADSRIVEEGRHWGAFMRRFWDVGDRSIFDLAIRGQHPRFYVAGVLERDDRDVLRKHAFFPTRAGTLLFENVRFAPGAFGIDLGCGGGQFGLAYARVGLDVVGIDPSFEELALAREHARSQGIANIDYVRAEPASPPIAPDSVDVLLAKDALHHVPDLADVMEKRVVPLLRPGARAFIQEHVAKSRRRRALLGHIAPPLIRKLRRRYPNCLIPPELLRDSANEDVSMDAVRPSLTRWFETEGDYAGHYFYLDVEGLVYFAFGKRRWFATLAKVAAWIVEHTFLALDTREFWSFRGRLRAKPGS